MNKKFLTVPFDVKAIDDDGKFSGYGSIFGNVDAYGEVVAPGAFAASLKEWKKKKKLPKLLWQHSPDKVIGRYTKMIEDENGLYVEGELFHKDIEQASEAYFLMKQGEIDGLSIGFMVKNDDFDRNKRTRTLIEIDLWEVSVVTFPANTAARVVGVKAADHIGDIRSFESFLIENGFSRNAAKSIASSGFRPSLNLRDADSETPSDIDLCDAASRALAGELSKLLTI